MSREAAASYIGIGVTLYDAMVDDGRMPKPRLINNRKVWDRRELDIAFDRLPNEVDPEDEANPFDGVRV